MVLLLEPKDLFGLAGVAVGLSSLLYTVISKRGTDIQGMKERLSSVETKISLFWGVMEKQAAAILIKPTHYERDEMIERYLRGELNERETEEFIEMLQAINSDKNASPGDRLAAATLGAIVEIKKVDEQKGKTKCG